MLTLPYISIIWYPYLHAVLLTERNIFINYFINAGFFSMNLIMEHLHLGYLGIKSLTNKTKKKIIVFKFCDCNSLYGTWKE